jgi:hypothetical protein
MLLLILFTPFCGLVAICALQAIFEAIASFMSYLVPMFLAKTRHMSFAKLTGLLASTTNFS